MILSAVKSLCAVSPRGRVIIASLQDFTAAVLAKMRRTLDLRSEKILEPGATRWPQAPISGPVAANGA